MQLPGVSEQEHRSSMDELERLGTTLGLQIVGRLSQRRSQLAPAAVLGEGKLAELAALTGGTGVVPSGARRKTRRIDEPQSDDRARDDESAHSDEPADSDPESAAQDLAESEQAGPSDAESTDMAESSFDDAAEDETAGETAGSEKDSSSPESDALRPTVVLVDHDLTPSQARNLERATGAEVLDRTSVILSIFQRHARTREALLQVEVARLAYEAPRLRETGGRDRQRGGIGGKGAGESNLELDRRKIRDRIAELRHELASIAHNAQVRRKRRTDAATVALVGYTNAGKSSWMRALTGGEVYVADKLFATLDTTVRALTPAVHQKILVSDTVGFIKKLPHDLVASFRSTLEEAREASLLVHVLDASDPAFREQFAVTRSVLSELDADDAPSIVLLNKVDKLTQDERELLGVEFSDALQVSARSDTDRARVHAAIVEFFERAMVEETFEIPYAKQGFTSRLHEETRVLSESYDEHGAVIKVRGTPAVIQRILRDLSRS